MGNSQHIATYQIDEADYTKEYGQLIMEGCQTMYPGKTIISSIEFIRKQVVLSVYATDQES